jgi:hypothetical protein
MAQQLIGVGSAANDGTGDPWRDAMIKCNENFTEVFGGFDAIDFVFVAQESDFPVQDATTITLEASQVYVVSASFSVDKRFVCENGFALSAFNQLGVVLTYTGTGSMFTGVDVSAGIYQISLNAPSGSLFSFSDVSVLNSHVVIITDISVVSCAKVGKFTSMASIVMDNVGVFNTNDGVTIVGAGWRVWRFQSFGQITSSATFIGFDLGAATCNLIEFSTIFINAPIGAIGIKGAPASANVIAGNLAKVINGDFIGGITAPISGITVDDTRWYFSLNNAIKDTMPDAMASLNNNATETVISVAATPVIANGTFTDERSSQFTVDATGRATYLGDRDLTAPVDIVTSIESASGTNKDIKIYLALNGSVIANSAKSNRVGAADPKNTACPWQLTLSKNDYLEIWVENTTDTTNLVVIDAILRVL